MMKAALALAGVIALSGCTTIHVASDWTKPAATAQQVTFDDMECERQSREIPAPPTSSSVASWTSPESSSKTANASPSTTTA